MFCYDFSSIEHAPGECPTGDTDCQGFVTIEKDPYEHAIHDETIYKPFCDGRYRDRVMEI